MLRLIRENTDSIFVKLIMALIAIVFVFFFGSSAMMSDQTQVVAEVNGEVIRDVALYTRTRNAIRFQQRYNPDMSQADQDRIQRQVLDQLIDEKLLLQVAKAENFLVSDAEVRQAIMDDPSFQTDEGKFDKAAYERYVESVGSTKLERDYRNRLAIRQLQEFIRRSVVVSPEEVRHSFLTEAVKRDVDFVRVNTAAFGDKVEVSDDEVAAWRKDNSGEVQARYDRDFSRKYDQPKKLKASHILMKFAEDEDEDVKAEVRSHMEAVLAEAKGDADFGELAQKWSEDGSAVKGGDLGLFDAKRMVPAFSEAAFALGVDEISGLVETRYGLHIIKVLEVHEASTQKLDEVADDIATELLKEEKTPEMAKAYASKLLAVLTGDLAGEEADALLAEHNLSVQNSGKFNSKDARIPKLGSDPAAIKAAFSLAAEGDVTAEPVELSTGFVVMKLTHKSEADMSSFEARKDEIQDQLLRSKAAQALTTWKADIKSEATIRVSSGV